MTRTLASFGVDFDAAPGIESAQKFGTALKKTGEDAKAFSTAFREASKGASDSAQEHAATVEAVGNRTGTVWRRMRTAADNALKSTIEQLSTLSAALGGNFAKAFDHGHAKVAALAAEIGLLVHGMGILAIPILAVGSAFGTTGTIIASVATLYFLFSERTLAARTALKLYLEQLGLTNIGLRMFTATAGAANTAAAAMGINLTASLAKTAAIIGGLVLGFFALKTAIDSVSEGAKRQIDTQKYGVRSRDLNDPASRIRPIIDSSLDLPGDSTSDILKGSAKLERASDGVLTLRENLERVSAAALVAGKDFSEVADKVADLYKELQNGDDAESTIRSLQKMGIFSDEARDRIAKLQEEGKKGPAVWDVAASALDAYGTVLEQRRGTFNAAKESFGKAWDEVKTVLGGAVSDLLTPALQVAAGVMRSTVGAAREVAQAIREMVAEFSNLPQTMRDFFLEWKNGGVFGKEGSLNGKESQHMDGSYHFRSRPIGSRLPDVNPLPEDKNKKGRGGRGGDPETDSSLVAKYRAEIEFLSKAMDDGTVSTGEFMSRQAKLRDTLASSLGDPSRYASDIEAFRAAQQEKLRILEVMKQDIERGNASLLTVITYGLEKALQESGKITKQMANAIPQLITGTADAFGSAFASIVTGSKGAGQAFREFAAGVLNDVARIIGRLLFLQAVEGTLGFFGIGPKSATGAGTAGIGDILSLGGSGSILSGSFGGKPAGPIGKAGRGGGGGDAGSVAVGDIHINIQSDGTADVQTDASGNSARKLAQGIRTAVQTELQNQLRPGGLLAPNTRRA